MKRKPFSETCEICGEKPYEGMMEDQYGNWSIYIECKCLPERQITRTARTRYGVDHDKAASLESVYPLLKQYMEDLINGNGGWNKFWKKKRILLPGHSNKYVIGPNNAKAQEQKVR